MATIRRAAQRVEGSLRYVLPQAGTEVFAIWGLNSGVMYMNLKAMLADRRGPASGGAPHQRKHTRRQKTTSGCFVKFAAGNVMPHTCSGRNSCVPARHTGGRGQRRKRDRAPPVRTGEGAGRQEAEEESAEAAHLLSSTLCTGGILPFNN